MFRRFRPTLENLERRDFLSASPIGMSTGMPLGVVATHDSPPAIVGSHHASNPPPVGPLKLHVPVAQDVYGDTMSVEEWMDWTSRPHDPTSGDSIFDFPGGRGRQ
jgi:hypothetical protein